MIGMRLELAMHDDEGENIKHPMDYGNFKCSKCGERHSSDTAMLLCGSEYQKNITKQIVSQ